MPHVEHVEDEQLEQEPLEPAIGVDEPELSLVKHANCDKIRFALQLHLGQVASLSQSFIERNISNL